MQSDNSQPLAFADSGKRLRIQVFPRQKTAGETREISRGFYSFIGWSDKIEGLRSLQIQFSCHLLKSEILQDGNLQS